MIAGMKNNQKHYRLSYEIRLFDPYVTCLQFCVCRELERFVTETEFSMKVFREKLPRSTVCTLVCTKSGILAMNLNKYMNAREGMMIGHI